MLCFHAKIQEKMETTEILTLVMRTTVLRAIIDIIRKSNGHEFTNVHILYCNPC